MPDTRLVSGIVLPRGAREITASMYAELAAQKPWAVTEYVLPQA